MALDVVYWGNSNRFDKFNSIVPRSRYFSLDTFDLKKIARNVTTKHFFLVLDCEFDDEFNFDFKPAKSDEDYNMVWPMKNIDGSTSDLGNVWLLKRRNVMRDDFELLQNVKVMDQVISKQPELDIIFLSYDEPTSDANYDKLKKRFPRAKRVHGIKGIFESHKECAKLSSTRNFYVVDADAIVVNDFDFNFVPEKYDEKYVHVWRAKNPVNGLVYGYGGVKLFPRQQLLQATEWKIDFTTSVSTHFKPMPEVSNVTAFNTSPFQTWKAAFRECVKLSSKTILRQKDDETQSRLEAWKKSSLGNYYEWAQSGAKDGEEFGVQNRDNIKNLMLINDYDWLKNFFVQKYGEVE